jgi:hypothetical protein
MVRHLRTASIPTRRDHSKRPANPIEGVEVAPFRRSRSSHCSRDSAVPRPDAQTPRGDTPDERGSGPEVHPRCNRYTRGSRCSNTARPLRHSLCATTTSVILAILPTTLKDRDHQRLGLPGRCPSSLRRIRSSSHSLSRQSGREGSLAIHFMPISRKGPLDRTQPRGRGRDPIVAALQALHAMQSVALQCRALHCNAGLLGRVQRCNGATLPDEGTG